MDILRFNGLDLNYQPTNVNKNKIDTSVVYRDINGKLVKNAGVTKIQLNISGITDERDKPLLESITEGELGTNTVSIIGYGINDSFTINASNLSIDYLPVKREGYKMFNYSFALEEV